MIIPMRRRMHHGHRKNGTVYCSSAEKNKRMTQKDFARMLNITGQSGTTKWERGISCPDISLLPSVADILGVTIHELLNGEQSNTRARRPGGGQGECPAICGQRSRSQRQVRCAAGAPLHVLCCCWPAAPACAVIDTSGFRQTHLGAFSHCLYGFRLACVLPAESR